MAHHKTISKRTKKKPVTTELTKSELEKLRAFLPYNYIQLIHQNHTSISIRQIKQVMAQNTTNAKDNLLVWKWINKVLTAAGQKKLAKRVEQKIFYYSSLCSITQK